MSTSNELEQLDAKQSNVRKLVLEYSKESICQMLNNLTDLLITFDQYASLVRLLK